MVINNNITICWTTGRYSGGNYFKSVNLPISFVKKSVSVFSQTFWEEYVAVGGSGLTATDIYVSNNKNQGSQTTYWIITIGY